MLQNTQVPTGGYVDGFTGEPEAREPEYFEASNECAQCSKGILTTTDLGVRKITTCNVCGFRQVIKV